MEEDSAQDGKRPSKRPRISEENDDDKQDEPEEDLLALVLAGGHDDDEEDDASRRRQQRRQRWKQVNHGNDDEPQQEASVQVQEARDNAADENDNRMNVEEEPPLATTRERNEEEDDFDMFSSSVSPVVKEAVVKKDTQASNLRHDEDVDDDEGYYKAVIGEMIPLGGVDFKVLGTVGKGVFSTVLKCTNVATKETVAIKCVRNNETMAKAAQTEIEILQTFQKTPHAHIVPMLFPTAQSPLSEHRGHKLLVFEYHGYNLRDVLQKFGKGVGLSLVSVKMYFGQLLSALHHLQRLSIVHADIKPDNMLVSDDFTTLKICDFGSAMDMRDSGNAIPTPYLVSRFYRAPEIILGYTPAFSMDLWSVAVTIAELFLGRVVFNGNSNNDMLRKIMEILGPLPQKQIKQHNIACKTYPLPRHFSDQHFLQQAVDPVTGKNIQKQLSLQKFPTTPLQSLLLKAKSSKDSRLQVQQLADLLKKCCALDPTRRISVKEALQHDFFKGKAVNNGTR